LRPLGGLDAFDGETLAGEWHLAVSDLASGDDGALVRWCLEVNGGAQPTATPTPTPQQGSLRQCFQPPGVVEIPDDDPTGVTADVVVTSAVQVNDLNVSLDIAHTWVGDLVVQLTHLGSGRTATLIDRPGAPDLSPGGCDQPDIVAVLDDEAGSPAEDECADGPAIAGTRRPSQALSVFDGITATGTWRLKITDAGSGDVGVLNNWCLGVNRSPIGP
jgi:subtilisin-like proprotein convertase family protein